MAHSWRHVMHVALSLQEGAKTEQGLPGLFGFDFRSETHLCPHGGVYSTPLTERLLASLKEGLPHAVQS